MKPIVKVILNTVVLYIKIIASMAITLIAVPLVLKALGVSDYGLYNLVAGIVAMLTFLNHSLTVSSQRYMSVAMGAGNHEKIVIVYNTSFFLHFILGIIVVLLLELGSLYIGMLNIVPSRMWCAKLIYQFLIVSTFFQIIAVPFDALINAYEDMIALAIIDFFDPFLKLMLALSLAFVPIDKLAYYCFCICMITIFIFFMKYLWVHHKYKNYHINIKLYRSNLQTKEMFSFAGWNLFGGLAVLGRNQGVAIIINLFLGTVTNAAYGIANHINGALASFSNTFQKAINPQLMKSEGMKNRERLLRISYASSMYSVLALSFFSIPLIIEMSDVLFLWLGENIPPYTMQLSRYILIMTIVYQYSAGIMSAIQAAGNIRNYQITMGCLILINIPLSYLVLKGGYPVYYIAICFVIIECVSLIVRIMMAYSLVQMLPIHFIKKVIRPTFFIIVVSVLSCLIPHYMLSNLWERLLSTSFVYCTIFLIMFWILAVEKEHKETILKKIKSWRK